MNYILFFLDLLGVATFATTGALVACRCKMDLFGVLLVAAVTALGGGTIRDLLLSDKPVFWVDQYFYLMLATASGATAFYAEKYIRQGRMVLIILDAVGLSAFTVIGVSISLDHGAHWSISIVLGMVSAVAGGIIRDLLCRDMPLILRKEIYATASIIGGATYILVLWVGVGEQFAVPTAAVVTFSIRMTAFAFGVSLPESAG